MNNAGIPVASSPGRKARVEASVEVKDVYKIFGPDPASAREMLARGHSKAEIFERTGMTVGVQDVSFSVNPGEVFVIMGLSGSGKSTLLRMINRLIEPTSGQISLNGQDVMRMSAGELIALRRREMGMVFQSFALMEHLKVWENAAFGLEVAGVAKPERRRRALEALEQVGLEAYWDSPPERLSGGMRQRVGLARALAVNPSLMLMDEAFSALDPLIRAEMQDELLRLQRDSRRSVIFISHDLNEAMRIGDRIAIMHDGRVLQIDTPKRIFQAPADDLVRSFFRGVDLAEVYTAGDVASRAGALVLDGHIPDLRGLIPRLRKAEHQVGYVCGPDGTYNGMISTPSLLFAVESGSDAPEAAFMETEPVAADAPLRAVIQAAARSDHPVPVIDAQGRFCGAISQGQLLQTLDQEREYEH